MPSISEIGDIVADAGVTLCGEIISNPLEVGAYYIPISYSRSKEKAQTPSGKTLAELRMRLLESGVIAQYILVDRQSERIEEGLRASLINTFPGLVRNSFVSRDRSNPFVYVDNKRALTSEEILGLKSHADVFLKRFNILRFDFAVLSDAPLPTRTELLSVLRRRAPIDIATLEKSLVSQGFVVPSVDWLNRQLDACRKSNLVLRLTDERYALTSQALFNLGTIKGRKSPDISRLLALAHRGR